MSDNVAIVLQARMQSHRLPGKAMLDVHGRSILSHCIDRLRHANVAPVIVATSTEPADDPIVAEAEACGAFACRGPHDDVLTRFLRVALWFDLDIIVRATADNPAVDIDAPARVLAHLHDTGADYVSERGLPYGAAVEAVRVLALERSMPLVDATDREHVTSAVRRHVSRFAVRLPWAPMPLVRSDLRFSVDTEGDLSYVRQVFHAAETGVDPAPLGCLIAAADELSTVQVAA